MTNVKLWAKESAAIGKKAVRLAIDDHLRHGRSVWISDNNGGVRKLSVPLNVGRATAQDASSPSTTLCGLVPTVEVRRAFSSHDDLFNISKSREDWHGQTSESKMIFEITICSVGDDLAGTPLRDEEALKASNVATEFVQCMSDFWLKDQINKDHGGAETAPSKERIKKLLKIVGTRKPFGRSSENSQLAHVVKPAKFKRMVLKHLSTSRLAWVEGMHSADSGSGIVRLDPVADSGISKREIADHLLLGHSLWLCGNDRTCVQIRKGSESLTARGSE